MKRIISVTIILIVVCSAFVFIVKKHGTKVASQISNTALSQQPKIIAVEERDINPAKMSDLKKSEALFYENFETPTAANWHGNQSDSLPGARDGYAMRAVPEVDNKWFGVKASFEPTESPVLEVDEPASLSFSYYLEWKSDIYVSFFNKTRDDNYHIWIRDPAVREWTTVSLPMSLLVDNSFKGMHVSKGDQLTNLRFFSGRPKSDPGLYIDDIAIKPVANFKASQNHTALEEKFDNGHPAGWDGEYTASPPGARTGGVMHTKPIQDRWFGARLTYQPSVPLMVVENTPMLEFSFFVDQPADVYVMVKDESRSDNFHFWIKNPQVGQWNTYTKKLLQLTDNSFKGKKIQQGDVITNLQFFAGKPGQSVTLYVDDVTIKNQSSGGKKIMSMVKNLFGNDSTTADGTAHIRETFETKPDAAWHGSVDADLPGDRTGSALKAMPETDNKWFGVKASFEPVQPMVEINAPLLFAMTYFIKEKTDIYVSFFNKTKNDNFHFWIKNPAVNEWGYVEKNVMFLTDNSFRGATIDLGDVLSNVRVFAGKPGSQVELWIDDVTLIPKPPQPAGEGIKNLKWEKYYAIDDKIIEHIRNIYSTRNRRQSIMNLGDSISESMAFMWVMRWEQEGLLVAEGYEYIPKGVSSRQRMKSDWGRQQVDRVLSIAQPETVTVLFGTNDLFLGGSDPQRYYDNMSYIVDACLKNGSIPMLLTIPPIGRVSAEGMKAFNDQLYRIAAEKNVPLIDIYTLFTDQGDWHLLLGDGLHPNQEGYALINNVLYEAYKVLEYYCMPREWHDPIHERPEFPTQKQASDSELPLAGLIGLSYPQKAQPVYSFGFDESSEGFIGNYTEIDGRKAVQLTYRKGELAVRGGHQFSVKPDTYIALSCYADKCYRFRVQLYNQSQEDNFWAGRRKLPQRTWTRYYFNINKDFFDNSNKRNEIQLNDIISAIQIYGDITDKDAKLYIDDIDVYYATDASYAYTLEQQFEELNKNIDSATLDRIDTTSLFADMNKKKDELASDIPDASDKETIIALKKELDDLRALFERAVFLQNMRTQFGLENPSFGIGIELPLRRISPGHPEYPFRGAITNHIEIAAARHEYENMQCYLVPLENNVRIADVKLVDCVHEDGQTILSGNELTWYRQGMVTTQRSWPISAYILGEKPDPLLPGEPFDLNTPQALWLTLYVPETQKPGRYKGKVIISDDADTDISCDISITVWDIQIPREGTFRTPTTLDFSQLQNFYEKPVSPGIQKEWYAFCLKYRIDPTSLYHTGTYPAIEYLTFCAERGLRTIVFGGNHYRKDIGDPNQVKHDYEAIKELNLLDKAVIYIADEPNNSPEAMMTIRKKADWVRANCPGLKTCGGVEPREALYGAIDVWDMQIDIFDPEQVAARQAAGDEVFWYVAAAPSFPYPNIQIDNDLMEARILFLMSWKYKLDGFEYYYINLWGDNVRGKNGKKWPDIPWNSYAFKSGSNSYNGDGQLIYPGRDMMPYASIRLEVVRDGIEDFELLAMLASYVERARENPELRDLVAEAESLLGVPDSIVLDTTHYTREPELINEFHTKLGNVLNRLKSELE